MNIFPWFYLEEEESWAYMYERDGYYFAYIFNSDTYRFIADAYPNGNAPSRLDGTTIVFNLISEGQRGTARAVFENDRDVFLTVSYEGSGSTSFNGTYVYGRIGADNADLEIEIEDDRDDLIDSFFSLRFNSNRGNYYYSFSVENNTFPEVGENGQYGVFTFEE